MEKRAGKQYQMDLCSGPILKRLLLFTLPLMCSSMLQLLFNAADIVVVGRFAGDESLAAVGSNGSLIGLVVNLFVGISIGANVLAARNFGAKNDEGVRKTVHTAMLISLLGGVLLMVVGLIGARQFLIWMASPPEVLEKATVYLRISFLGMPAMLIYNFGAALMRAVGDTKRPLYFLIAAGIINVILNLISVILLRMDVAGVGLATVLSQVVSAVLVVRCLLHEPGAMRLELRALRIDWRTLGQILRIGLPAGVQGIIFSISNVMIQSSINGFGAVAVAGNSAAGNIESFVYMAMNAFYQATISFTSQNYGAGNYHRIRRALLASQGCVIVVGLVLGNLAVLFGRQLLGIYSTSPEVIEVGIHRLEVISATYFLCGIMDVMVGALRGIGYSLAPMIVSIVGVCGFRLGWLATVFRLEQFHTLRTVYLSYPISWIITAAVHIGCFIWAYRRMLRQAQQEAAA